jgi:hypothetical protein
VVTLDPLGDPEDTYLETMMKNVEAMEEVLR